MISVRFSHEDHYQDGSWDADTIEMVTDAAYNPTVLRDLRDAALTMLTERDDHLAELAASEEADDWDEDSEVGDE